MREEEEEEEEEDEEEEDEEEEEVFKARAVNEGDAERDHARRRKSTRRRGRV